MPSGIPTRLQNVVEDTTPQLGGNLDVNSFSIVSTSNGNVIINPDGSGNVVIADDDTLLQFGAGQEYSIQYDTNSNAVHTISTGDFLFSGGMVGIGTTGSNFATLNVQRTADGGQALLQTLRNFATSNDTEVAIRFENTTAQGANNGTAEIAAIRTNSGAAGATDLVLRRNPGGNVTPIDTLVIRGSGDTQIGDGGTANYAEFSETGDQTFVGTARLTMGDSQKLYFGDQPDASIMYDDTNMVFTQEVGSGAFDFVDGNLLSLNQKVCMTAIGGIAVKLTNETGSNTIAGQLVKADTATDDAVVLAAVGDIECIGVFLDSGVADAAEAWVVVSGIADVALDDNVAGVRGNWMGTGVLAGYAATGTSPPAAPDHFEEIGHCIENVTAGGGGTHILARCVLHFN